MRALDDAEKLVANAYPDPDGPGCVVMVQIDGEPVFAKAFGVTRLEDGEAIDLRTNFRLASMTKQFTAAAILRLVENEQLRLDETLTDIFADFPEYGAAITVRHLLGHTSGLKDYENLMPENTTEQILDAGVLQIMKDQSEGDFAPGEQYAYSNSGYAVLAMIVEERSGKRFATYLHDEFFEPFGMTGTVAFENGLSEVTRRAYGHRTNDEGKLEFSDQSMTSAVLGDGGIYTSVVDYGKWAQAWFDGKILSPEMQRLAWTNGLLDDGTVTEYGYGWRFSEIEGERVAWHTGGTRGFNTNCHLAPKERLCVVMLANRNGDEPKELVPRITELVLAAVTN